MNELDKLRKMLDDAKIPYKSYQKEWDNIPPHNFSGEAGKYEINRVVYSIDEWKIEGVYHWGSFGAAEGLIETFGDLWVDETEVPMVMTAQEVFDIIKEDWQNEKKQ